MKIKIELKSGIGLILKQFSDDSIIQTFKLVSVLQTEKSGIKLMLFHVHTL